ncbi:MAG: S-layer homology domain-containing protein [Oscillospiraceae bacterium]|nr:S-layer homology domain-containing protein [Oscillospiraceae bacterium]
MKKKLISLALAAVMVVMMGTPVLAAKMPSNYPFEDTPKSHWAYASVYYCWFYDIVEGISDTEFDPDDTLTRAQFITMMGRATHEDEIQAQVASTDSWYSAYVRYLSNEGCLDGISIDSNSLSQAISRQEMALIMYNICTNYNTEANIDASDALSNVPDASEINAKYKDAVEYCYYIGLLTGGEDGSFRPLDTLTRAEAATVLRKTCYWCQASETRRTLLTDVGLNETVINQITSALIIDNINDWREENGLKRLETMEFMNEACMIRAEEISVSFSHTRPNGEVAGTVYDELFGLKMGAGENIVSNQNLLTVTLTEAAETFVEQWKNSPGHNANMLSDANYIGCGVYVSSNNIYSATHILARSDLEAGGYDSWL